jgi:hypothetical protein
MKFAGLLVREMLRFIVAWLAIMNRDCMWLRHACVPKVVCLGSGFEACDHVAYKCSAMKTSEECHGA